MRHWNRPAPVLVALLIGMLATSLFSIATLADPASAWAQATADEPVGELILEEPVEEPRGRSGQAAPDSPDIQDRTMLEWMYASLGISYSLVFLAISFTLVSLLVMNILTARREAVVPAALIENFEALLNEKNYQGAYELTKADESMLGQVLSSGLARISQGYSHAIEGMQETGEEENMKLEHRLSYIAMIAQISPMIGLLGTVQGMIGAFQTIATSATAPKPAQLAGDISTALFTTLVGLMIAIPAIAAFTILRNRIARLVLEVGILSENLMSRFSNVGPKKE